MSTLNENEELSLEEWIEKFKPIEKNGDIRQFETYGEDLEELNLYNKNQIWTVLDGDGCELYLSNGIWFVNRMFYIVCEVECLEQRGHINLNY